MEDFKGTPGPWYFSNEGTLKIRAEEDDEVICSYAGYEYFEKEYANSKLIAAAPELLEALQLTEKAMAEGRNVTYPEWYGVINKARIAIAKALGK